MSPRLLFLVTILAACGSKGAGPAAPPAPADLAAQCKPVCATDGSTFESTKDGQCVCALPAPAGPVEARFACTGLGCASACAPNSCASWRMNPSGNCTFYCIRNWRGDPTY